MVLGRVSVSKLRPSVACIAVCLSAGAFVIHQAALHQYGSNSRVGTDFALDKLRF